MLGSCWKNDNVIYFHFQQILTYVSDLQYAALRFEEDFACQLGNNKANNFLISISSW